MSQKQVLKVGLVVCSLRIAISWVELIVGLNMLINGIQFSTIQFNNGLLQIVLQTKNESTQLTEENCRMISYVYNVASKKEIVSEKIEKVRVVIKNKNGYPFYDNLEEQGTRVIVYWLDPSEERDLWNEDRWGLGEK